MDRQAFFGLPFAKRLEQRLLVGEVLIMAEASGANLIFDHVFHYVPLQKTAARHGGAQLPRTLLAGRRTVPVMAVEGGAMSPGKLLVIPGQLCIPAHLPDRRT